MSIKPTHTAYIVVEPKAGIDRKPQWIEIGAIWPHGKGSGFDLVVPAGLSVAGRIVCASNARSSPRSQPHNDPTPSHHAAGFFSVSQDDCLAPPDPSEG